MLHLWKLLNKNYFIPQRGKNFVKYVRQTFRPFNIPCSISSCDFCCVVFDLQRYFFLPLLLPSTLLARSKKVEKLEIKVSCQNYI
jgi:hypothetical protein